MKLCYAFLFIFIANIYAQYDVTAGMGINFTNMTSLNRYIAGYAPVNERRDDFYTNVEFYGEIGRMISEDWQLALEYFYSIYSYNTNYRGLGRYEISYYTHAPSLLVYYVIKGNGYKFKFGGGLGYRFVSLDEILPTTNDVITYNTSGPGGILKVDGNTALGSNLYVNIGLLLKFDYPGIPKLDGKKLTDVYNEEINVNTFSAGIRFGLTYSF